MNCVDKKEVEKLVKELSPTSRMIFDMMLLLLITKEKLDNQLSEKGNLQG